MPKHNYLGSYPIQLCLYKYGTYIPSQSIGDAFMLLLWPCIILLPLCMTTFGAHEWLFPDTWWQDSVYYPSPLGLLLGLSSVILGITFTCLYHWTRIHNIICSKPVFIQPNAVSKYHFWTGFREYLTSPEGFIMIGGYLSSTWIFRMMPKSYYLYNDGINWLHVFAQLLIQDFLQFVMHLAQHKVSSIVYRSSHKQHHRFVSPCLFNAFDGSIGDTVCMIIVPLYVTSQIFHVNVWTYMTFGTIYSMSLVLIHSDHPHPWEPVFQFCLIGTSTDHKLHHQLFHCNYEGEVFEEP